MMEDAKSNKMDKKDNSLHVPYDHHILNTLKATRIDVMAHICYYYIGQKFILFYPVGLYLTGKQ